MAAERENWRLMLNCSKMSRALAAPPGPTPREYQGLAGTHEKLTGLVPGGTVVG